jgi:GTP-binding protein
MKIQSAQFVKSAVEPSHYPPDVVPEAAFAGKSNVGKSSLINALVQRRGLAKTSSSPGCTQLINFFTINDSLSFVDLPGYGYARVPEEVKKNWGPMVEAYLKGRKALRLVVLVLDIRREPGELDLTMVRWFEFYGIPYVFVLTKIDKLSRQQTIRRRQEIVKDLGGTTMPAILFSAKTGAGKEDLWKIIEKHMV